MDLHNYASANGVNVKKENWNTLNRKVLSKIGMKLNQDTVHQLANGHQGAIKKILQELKNKVTVNKENEQVSVNDNNNHNKETESNELNEGILHSNECPHIKINFSNNHLNFTEDTKEFENIDHEKLVTESLLLPVKVPKRSRILSKLEYSIGIVLWGIWQLIKWLLFWNLISSFWKNIKIKLSKFIK